MVIEFKRRDPDRGDYLPNGQIADMHVQCVTSPMILPSPGVVRNLVAVPAILTALVLHTQLIYFICESM